MEIDWFTFIAQIVNFLILVALLRHFLYKPVMRAMDKREEKIASRLEEGRRAKEEAEEEKAALRQEREELEKKRRQGLEDAEQEARERREALLDEARQEVEETREAWRRSVEEDSEAFLEDLRQKAGEEILSVLRSALQDLSGRALEDRIIEVFEERLRKLEDGEKDKIRAAAAKSEGGLRISSAFELPEKRRERLRTALDEALDSPGEVRFETEADTLCGLELHTDGWKAGWSLDTYLDRLEERLLPLLRRKRNQDGEDGEDEEETHES